MKKFDVLMMNLIEMWKRWSEGNMSECMKHDCLETKLPYAFAHVKYSISYANDATIDIIVIKKYKSTSDV